MIALELVLGIVAGSLLYRAVQRVLVRLAAKQRPVKHLDEIAGSDRSATLDQLIEAVRAAALRVEVTTSGFDVRSQPPSQVDDVVRVRVLDPARASVATLQLTYQGNDFLAFQVVLALVPALGPLTITIDGDRIEVDGTRDVYELTCAHASYIRARIRECIGALRSPAGR